MAHLHRTGLKPRVPSTIELFPAGQRHSSLTTINRRPSIRPPSPFSTPVLEILTHSRETSVSTILAIDAQRL